MKLELGSGYFPTEGYVHLDANKNAPGVDIVGTAYPLHLPDASADEILAIDVLEHLPYRQTEAALTDWCRVLRPGGCLYVRVPDFGTIARWYVEEPEHLIERLPEDLPQTVAMGAAWRIMGGQEDGVNARGRDEWRLNAHYALFDADELERQLLAAGFVTILLERDTHPNLCATAHKGAP